MRSEVSMGSFGDAIKYIVASVLEFNMPPTARIKVKLGALSKFTNPEIVKDAPKLHGEWRMLGSVVDCPTLVALAVFDPGKDELKHIILSRLHSLGRDVRGMTVTVVASRFPATRSLAEKIPPPLRLGQPKSAALQEALSLSEFLVGRAECRSKRIKVEVCINLSNKTFVAQEKAGLPRETEVTQQIRKLEARGRPAVRRNMETKRHIVFSPCELDEHKLCTGSVCVGENLRFERFV